MYSTCPERFWLSLLYTTSAPFVKMICRAGAHQCAGLMTNIRSNVPSNDLCMLEIHPHTHGHNSSLRVAGCVARRRLTAVPERRGSSRCNPSGPICRAHPNSRQRCEFHIRAVSLPVLAQQHSCVKHGLRVRRSPPHHHHHDPRGRHQALCEPGSRE